MTASPDPTDLTRASCEARLSSILPMRNGFSSRSCRSCGNLMYASNLGASHGLKLSGEEVFWILD